MAEAVNKQELVPIMVEAFQRYTGKYIPAMGANWDLCLNEIYPIIQNNLPSTFYRNPRAFLKPRNKTFITKSRDPISGKMQEKEMDSSKSAKTQEAILNYSLTRINYKKEVRKVLLDAFLFPHSVLWHGYKGDYGMTEEQSLCIENGQVFVQRINPINFIKDPSVNMSNLDEAKWVGRIIDIPLQDLLDDDKLDVDTKLIKGFKGYGDKIKTGERTGYGQFMQTAGGDTKILDGAVKPLLDFASPDFKNSKHANFVRLYEIYKRPSKKEKRKGDSGTILLLCGEQQKPLRVNDWGIKAEGWPSKLLSFNELNDAMFGLADIDTYKQIADQKNAIINLQLRNAQQNSKVYVALAKEGMDGDEDVEKIQNGDQTIILFPTDNVTGRMSVQSAGGSASSELYLIDGRIQKNLEDKSGVTDLKRGFLQSGEESAASVKIRSAGGGARPAYRQDIMADFLKDSLHYINQLNKQFIPYEDAVRLIGSLDLQWSDKMSKSELQADTDVEIDVISMLPENPESELEHLNATLSLFYQGLTVPQIAQKIAQEGKTINLAPIIEQILLRQRINNPDVFRNIKPEESMGFVSVQQLKMAQANVEGIMHGQQVQFPPQEGDDHNAQLQVYTPILKLLQEAGQEQTQAFQMLAQLVQLQSAMLQQAQEKQASSGQSVNLKGPSKVTT